MPERKFGTWTAVITSGQVPGNTDPNLFQWQLADLTAVEQDTVRRYVALQSNPELRSENKDHIASALQSHARTIERIFQRVVLEDATLTVEGFEYNFTEEARSAPTIGKVLSIMLESLYEARFPMHPYLGGTLRMSDVSALATDFFSGARVDLEQTQRLAASFCYPLGVAVKSGDAFVASSAEVLTTLPLCNLVLNAVASARDGRAKIADVLAAAANQPYGITAEGTVTVVASTCRIVPDANSTS